MFYFYSWRTPMPTPYKSKYANLGPKIEALLAEGLRPREVAEKLHVPKYVVYRRHKLLTIGLSRIGGTNGHSSTSTQVTPTSGAPTSHEETSIAYAFGHIEAWLDAFAQSAGVPRATLAARLAAMLQRSARR